MQETASIVQANMIIKAMGEEMESKTFERRLKITRMLRLIRCDDEQE